MTDKKGSLNFSGLSSVIYLILCVGLGYFVYGRSLDMLIAVAVLSILMSLALYLSLIPFVGFIVYALVAKFCIIPWMFSFSGLYDTWLISLMFWLGTALGGVTSYSVWINFAIRSPRFLNTTSRPRNRVVRPILDSDPIRPFPKTKKAGAKGAAGKKTRLRIHRYGRRPKPL